jgi:ribulose-5-phosphate 4-epimerase/fuculose-1-phosphate aldolase
VKRQIEKYAARLLRDRSAAPGRYAFAAKDGGTVAEGDPELVRLAEGALSRLSRKALLVARPSLPFAELLVRRAPRGRRRIVPRDSESRTFLHDIPFLRAGKGENDPSARIAALLSSRNAGIVEGVGIVAAGAATVEQAYVHYSSVFHATFVKYLEELLRDGFLVPGEEEALGEFRDGWPAPIPEEGRTFRRGPLVERAHILEELAEVGRRTVERGLVDSVFGNISCLAGGVIHISRTGASLDDLEGNVVAVPLDSPPSAAHAASSDLPIHRRIYEAGAVRVILHGHPRFTVLLSLLCREKECGAADRARDRGRMRFPADAPLLGGEAGEVEGGTKVPEAVASRGIAVVRGHGVFAVGREGFAEPFRSMAVLENRCRSEYFRRLGRE